MRTHRNSASHEYASESSSEKENKPIKSGSGQANPLWSNLTLAAGQPVIQRQTNSAPEEEISLANKRFVGNRHLHKIVNGEVDALSEKHNGNTVSVVQRALVDLGFDLPLHRVDSSFGEETVEAIRQFRTHYLEDGLNVMDANALIMLDLISPEPGERYEHHFDYDRLFADNQLSVTVGFGYSGSKSYTEKDGKRVESDTDVGVENANKFREWLQSQNFELLAIGLDSDELWETTKKITFPTNQGNQETRDIRIVVTLISPGKGAARAFREGLAESEVTMYGGHARYGSGPDFDEKDSALENFRIGIDEAMEKAGKATRYDEAKRHGVVMDEEHDLKQMVESGEFDPEKYRILMFKACTSMAYLDEIRSELGGTENIDVIGSRVPTWSPRNIDDINPNAQIALLNGLMHAHTVEQIVDIMEAPQQALYKEHRGRAVDKGVYTTSGIGDNNLAR